MARPLRIEFAGATYHVMARGNQGQKICVAWWLYGQTTVRRRWVAEQLRMGYETRVSQAVSLVESSREPLVKKLKSKLNHC